MCPVDYPGPIGVPISFLDRYNPDEYEILELLRPQINGKVLYARVLIRNRNPILPDYVDINEMLEKAGSKYRVVLEEVEMNEKV